MFIFNDILKTTIWGGDKIGRFKGYGSVPVHVGESWEISAVEGSESVVADGPDCGLTITQLVDKYGEKLLGKSVVDRFGKRFPLLVKFIDASADLSVQVHPNDAQAIERHGQSGKTEMWYVMESDDKASLKVGFKKDMTKEEYRESVEHSTIAEKLVTYNVKKGDVFFLPPGRIHTIGAGTFLAEIQESSDITYRIYDYDRVDKNGNPRQLHTDLAVDVIDYKAQENYKTVYDVDEQGTTILAKCKYFTTSLVSTDSYLERDYEDVDSFVIIMCMKGDAVITDADTMEQRPVKQGDTILFPATTKRIEINAAEHSDFLEVTV